MPKISDMSKIIILIYTLDKYNLQTGIVKFPDHENLLKEVVVRLSMNANRAWSRKLGQLPILAKKGTFFEKRAKYGTTNFTTPYSNQFLIFIKGDRVRKSDVVFV